MTEQPVTTNKGLLSQLTDQQREKALSYDGPEAVGPAAASMVPRTTICPRCEQPVTAGHECHWYDRLLVTRGVEQPLEIIPAGERRVLKVVRR